MPNGHDRDYVRLCLAVDGFRARFGRWPARVKMFLGMVEVIRSILTDAGFAQVTDKVQLVEEEDAPFVAEDDAGNSFNYRQEGFHETRPDISDDDWFGNPPHRDHDDLSGFQLVE